MLVHNLVVTGSLTFPTALPISGSLLVSGSLNVGTTAPVAKLASYLFGGATASLGDNIVLGVGTDGGVVGTYTQIGIGYNNGNTGQYYPAIIGSVIENSTGQNTEAIIFATRPTATGTTRPIERMRISSSGSVGINTSPNLTTWSNASRGMEIYGSAGTYSMVKLNSADLGNFYLINGVSQYWIYGEGNYPMGFYTSGSQRMTITATGSVGIGVTNPTYKLDIYNGADFDIRLRDTSLGGTVGILFESANDFSGTSQSYIKGVGASNSGVSYLIFGTANTSGAVTGSERMRITSDGNVLIGTTSDSGQALVVQAAKVNTYLLTTTNNDTLRVQNNYASLGASANLLLQTTGIGAGTTAFFIYGELAGGSNTFRVYNNGNVQNTNNSYTALSDIKLKENIIDTAPKLMDLLKVRIVNYNLKEPYETYKQIGIIAQELEQIFPGLVEDTKDRNSNEIIKSVKYSVFVPILIKAIQEQQATIEALTTRITALEN
jgi:hypothetical protein